MEKENIAWLVIRALGIYIGFEAITKFIGFANYYVIYEAQSQMSDFNKTTLLVRFGFSVVVFLLYTYMSYYCLRKGSFLHKLILFNNNDNKA